MFYLCLFISNNTIYDLYRYRIPSWNILAIYEIVNVFLKREKTI